MEVSAFEALKGKARKLFYKAEINRAVFFGVMAKVWAVIAGPLTALLIIIRFNPLYQGYYYTFGSLLALQVFVELGLGNVIIQFASHEWAKLTLDNKGNITGERTALSRLASLAGITLRWYMAGGVVIAFGLGLAGYFFFRQSHSPAVDWVWPWFSLCFFTAISVCLIPLWSLLEGCNQVSVVYTYRFFQGIIASLALWSGILAGIKLWAAPISVAATLLYAFFFLRYKYRNFIKGLLFNEYSHYRIDWRKEILPLQWRVALCWISSYFISSLFTPVIFHYYGPVVAGQFGITWSIVGVIGALSGSWLSPRVPAFGMQIAKKNYLELDTLFFRITKVFMVILALCALAVWFVLYAFNRLQHPFAERLLPVLPMTLFLTGQLVIMLSFPFSVYLRAHKKEPFLLISIAGATLTALSTFILGKYFSVQPKRMLHKRFSQDSLFFFCFWGMKKLSS